MKYLTCTVCHSPYMIETPDAIDSTTFTCPVCQSHRSNSGVIWQCTSYLDVNGHQSADNPPYVRCGNRAVYRLIDHEGKPVPGTRICERCATQCIVEYAEKLGWEWSVVDL